METKPMNIADERLWWGRTLPKLNGPERERLLALLAEIHRMQTEGTARVEYLEAERRRLEDGFDRAVVLAATYRRAALALRDAWRNAEARARSATTEWRWARHRTKQVVDMGAELREAYRQTWHQMRLAETERDALRAAVAAARDCEAFYIERAHAMYEDEASLWAAFGAAARETAAQE